jgi:hypothetical protein
MQTPNNISLPTATDLQQEVQSNSNPFIVDSSAHRPRQRRDVTFHKVLPSLPASLPSVGDGRSLSWFVVESIEARMKTMSDAAYCAGSLIDGQPYPFA